jgi:hypothetical protein
MHDRDDFRHYRRGRAAPSWQPKPVGRKRREVSEKYRRKRFAEALARAELGRFYWSGKLDQELEASMRRGRKNNASGRNRGHP